MWNPSYYLAVITALLLASPTAAQVPVVEPGGMIDLVPPVNAATAFKGCEKGKCDAQFDEAGGVGEVSTFLSALALEDRRAAVLMWKSFRVGGADPGRILRARITGRPFAIGRLVAEGLGVIAKFNLVVDLLDCNGPCKEPPDPSERLIYSETILEEICDGSLFEDGLCSNKVDLTVNFTDEVHLLTQTDYRLRLVIRCTSEASFLETLDSQCNFLDPIGFPDAARAGWRLFTIQVEDDLVERLDQLLEGQEKLKEGQAEVIRLLLTPQGRRESDLGSFPLKPNPPTKKKGKKKKKKK